MENNDVHSDEIEAKYPTILEIYPALNNDIGKTAYILHVLHHITTSGKMSDVDGKEICLKPAFKDKYYISEAELCRIVVKSVHNITKEDFDRIFIQIKFLLNVNFTYEGNKAEYSFGFIDNR